MSSSKVAKGKGKSKGKGKARAAVGPAAAAGDLANSRRMSMMDEEDVKAAIERGDVERVSIFLRQLFPRGAQQSGAELRCMRRAMSLLDSGWKAEVEKKRKATFASEDKGMVDAVLMGGVYLPSDTFASVIEFVDHRTAVRSTPCSKAWWRTISDLSPASHIDTSLRARGKGIGWSDLLTQIKNIRASNPRRSVSRLSLDHSLKLGSFPNLWKATGGLLTHLDLTGCTGTQKINFAALVEQLPSLKGLGVEETFYDASVARRWLLGLAYFVRTVKLESLRLGAHECQVQDNPASNGRRSKWIFSMESKITDNTLEDLANANKSPRLYAEMFELLGRGDGPSSLQKLWLSSPRRGPRITTGLVAVGANTPHLEELVVDDLQVTDDGWRKFATARIDAAAAAARAATYGGTSSSSSSFSSLRHLRIRANGAASVPSATTRDLLENLVSNRVTLYVSGQGTPAAGGGGGGGGSSSSGGVSGDEPQLVDCEGAAIEVTSKEKFSAAKTCIVRLGNSGRLRLGQFAGWA